MSTTPHFADVPGDTSLGRTRARTGIGDISITGLRLAVAAAFVLLAVAAFSLWQVGSSLARQACIDSAVGRYPAVPVSAYAGRDTGALKLSFTAERQKAVAACS